MYIVEAEVYLFWLPRAYNGGELANSVPRRGNNSSSVAVVSSSAVNTRLGFGLL